MSGVLVCGDNVHANWNRWVVLCSAAPFCFGAMQVYPGQNLVACGECGTTLGPLVWPADPDAIEMILMMRPDVRTRNWHPGETLEDLLAENLAHGVKLPARGTGTYTLLCTVDGVLTGGALSLLLPSDIRRHRIEAADSPQGV